MKNIKTQIIKLLGDHKNWVSGETISQQFGISRAAIGKHINALRKEGYLIQAVTRRGYLLKQAPDTIELKKIQYQSNTQLLGHAQWFLLPETSSTNQEAILKAIAGAPEGSIIIASKQTAGRGTKGKTWFSAPRSIYFSVILRPAFNLEKLPLLINMGMLATQDTLKKVTHLKTTLQQPNDIYINDRKIAGVSIEASIISHEIDWAVLGIGCNLNVEISEFPAQMQPHATSTLHETRQLIERNLFYKILIQQLDYYYYLLSDQTEQFQKIWQSRFKYGTANKAISTS